MSIDYDSDMFCGLIPMTVAPCKDNDQTDCEYTYNHKTYSMKIEGTENMPAYGE